MEPPNHANYGEPLRDVLLHVFPGITSSPIKLLDKTDTKKGHGFLLLSRETMFANNLAINVFHILPSF